MKKPLITLLLLASSSVYAAADECNKECNDYYIKHKAHTLQNMDKHLMFSVLAENVIVSLERFNHDKTAASALDAYEKSYSFYYFVAGLSDSALNSSEKMLYMKVSKNIEKAALDKELNARIEDVKNAVVALK